MINCAPLGHQQASVQGLMLNVCYALIPGLLMLVWFFGIGIIVQCLLAVAAALFAEAAVLYLRGRPVWPTLSDGSALLTGLLLGLSLPAVAPWWIAVIGGLFAIVIAKQLYGGLGFNPFNPAMVGYVVLLISFPMEMSTWGLPHSLMQNPPGLLDSMAVIFAGLPVAGGGVDAITGATPLDTMKTQLGLMATMDEIHAAPMFGDFGGKGFEWVANGFMVGGIWLIYRGVISWHIPVAVLGGLFGMATLFYLGDPDSHASPMFHLFSGASMMTAFFIATDPVSAATTPKGRLWYGAGIGVLACIIRTLGGYPDGFAFAVLLMNMAVPTIDYYTQPRLFGASK